MLEFTINTIERKDCRLGVWFDSKGLPIGIKSIERPWLNNAPKISSIPQGVYTCKPFKSPSKGEVWLLEETAPRSMIEIHVANFASELEGCIAPGLDIVAMRQKDVLKPAVASSGAAMDKLKVLTGYQAFRLVIV